MTIAADLGCFVAHNECHDEGSNADAGSVPNRLTYLLPQLLKHKSQKIQTECENVGLHKCCMAALSAGFVTVMQRSSNKPGIARCKRNIGNKIVIFR